MTYDQERQLEELENTIFTFVNSHTEDTDRHDAAMRIIYQALCGGEHYFDEHKFLLTETGKWYRKTRKEVLVNDGVWDEYSESVIKQKK
jgi:hypothetical protein